MIWCPLWRSGLAENQTITEKNHDYELFTQALTEVCAVLSRKIAKDGEGATRLLECAVTGAKQKRMQEQLQNP